MAQKISNCYNLSNPGSRKLGLTKSSRFRGPHAHRFDSQNSQSQRKKIDKHSDADVDAPPQDLSEEEQTPVFKAEEYGEASDISDEDSARKRKPRSEKQDPATSSGSYGPNGQHPQKLESQSCGRKRKIEQVSNNDPTLNVSFNLSRTGRKSNPVGYGRTRVQTRKKNMSGCPEERDPEAFISKKNSVQNRKTSAFVRPPVEIILAELERKRCHAGSSNPPSLSSQNPLSKKRSERDDIDPPSPSQTEQPMFRAPQLSCQDSETMNKDRKCSTKTNSVMAHRSSQKLKSLSCTSNKINVGHLSNPATIAAQRLGLEEAAFKLSSSFPSVSSPTDKIGGARSIFSSPPTSWNDDVSATGFKTISVEDSLSEPISKLGSVCETPPEPRCPICKATVDSLFLESFTEHRRLTIREQARFCQAHQRRTATEEWKTKGYPTIDWSCLHMQVKIHSEAIDEIFKGERFSYYRNAYDDFLKREKHKTLRQSLIQGGGIEDFSPGYYGSRGARIMIDNLMSNFSSKLRRRASDDQLISARGVTTYVHAVLVPELATLLVMDDMKIDAEEARKVLHDSVELGNLLNEEQDEMIRDPEMDDIS